MDLLWSLFYYTKHGFPLPEIWKNKSIRPFLEWQCNEKFKIAHYLQLNSILHFIIDIFTIIILTIEHFLLALEYCKKTKYETQFWEAWIKDQIYKHIDLDNLIGYFKIYFEPLIGSYLTFMPRRLTLVPTRL